MFGALSLGDFCLYSARNFSLRVQLGWRRLSLHINGVRSFWLFKKAVGIVFVVAARGYQCVYGGISF